MSEDVLPPVPHLSRADLGTFSRRVRQILFRYIARSYFREGQPESDAADPRHWQHSPLECGLEVFFRHGRWFARWTWPGEGEEFIRFDLDERGWLMQYEVPEREAADGRTEGLFSSPQ